MRRRVFWFFCFAFDLILILMLVFRRLWGLLAAPGTLTLYPQALHVLC